MKILLSAAACQPAHGSEAAIGWETALQLAKEHQVWVLTHRNNKDSIEKSQALGEGSNIVFIYAGRESTWYRNSLLARLQSWKMYIDFQREALLISSELHSKIVFDLVHHVTIATWRVASPLWQLRTPFVWGPVGGCGRVPFRFYGTLSIPAATFELCREISSVYAKISSKVRNCCRKASIVLASNRESRLFLNKLSGRTSGIDELFSAHFSDAKIKKFSPLAAQRPKQGPLIIFGGGFLIGSKGVSLAIRALHIAKSQNIQFKYLLGGYGPEVPYLVRLTRILGLESEISFIPPLKGDDYIRQLQSSHIFLLPSFRETAPITILEAMLCGCVPIVLNISAQGEVVTDECGMRIAATKPTHAINDISKSITYLYHNRQLIDEIGVKARQRVMENYTEQNYQNGLTKAYSAAVNQFAQKNNE